MHFKTILRKLAMEIDSNAVSLNLSFLGKGNITISKEIQGYKLKFNILSTFLIDF